MNRWRILRRVGSGRDRCSTSSELEDPRSTINHQHPLASVVVIALMAVLAGAGGPTAIASWAAIKEESLVQVLDLPNGVPRKDVFRRVLMALEARRLPGVLRRLAAVACAPTAAAATGVEQPVLAVDGKTAAAQPRPQERPGGVCIR